MEENDSNYYVYVYIDPRNNEEFYYGKGSGKRKEAHLRAKYDSEKSKIIRAIRKEGIEPIIRVIAKDLTEKEAFLVEKTLLWKLGKTLVNKSTGNFSRKFRPHNTMHKKLPLFDFKNDIYFVNVGEDKSKLRSWEDCTKYGFLSAGQNKKYSDPIRTLESGDIVVAYLKGKGYVGIGKVLEKACRINDFKFKGKSLRDYKINSNIFNNADNENSDYAVKVKWIKKVMKEDAISVEGKELFTSRLVKSSLKNQENTIIHLEKSFGLNFTKLLN
ncbi:MAG TPA: GIY-YIG nuclease family protein [Ignavibacteriaceae bacterium]|nr:GIY-YIG nuclease family protein [Ignavibacteriaceae bacterium]